MEYKTFRPDYRNIENAARNIEAERTPLYEHNISDLVMEKMTGRKFAHLFSEGEGEERERNLDRYFAEYDRFFAEHGYDTVTYEGCITDILPHGGALAHPQPGWIDSREKFEEYPWEQVKGLYVAKVDPIFRAMKRNLPEGMKAIGGVGNGVFEIVQDLCGYETLCLISFDDPELYADLFRKVGDLMAEIWKWFLAEHGEAYCVCRFGDDLGYKSNTLLSPEDIRSHILPQYKRIVDLVHAAGKPFLLHSCGNIFSVMDDLIEEVGIDAKHSNEDQISDFREWVERYGKRIGNFGGVDTDHLCRMDAEELRELVTKLYEDCHTGCGGFALGSGNSIAPYVDPERYAVMIDTVRKLRGDF